MSNLKNTYGFSSSLLDAIRSVHETSNEEVEQIDEGKTQLKANDKATMYKHVNGDYSIERKRDNKVVHYGTKGSATKLWNQIYAPGMKEEVEQIDEISSTAKRRYLGTAVADLTNRAQEHGFHTGSNFYGKGSKTHDYATAGRKIRNRQVGIYRATQINPKNPYKEEIEQVDEADHTYPFKANQLAPLVVQLRSLLNFLSKSGALKKSMREHAELVEAYIGEEITEEQLEEMISFVDDLMEGRPKGSKNKSKMASAPKPEARVEKGESEEDEDYEDAHPAASRDGRHIIPELNAAAGDKKGAKVQTSGGQRHVPQHVAGKMVSHLMSLKPAERGEHSAHIFNGSVPKVKTLNHVKTNVLIKQMGSEKKIGSDAGVKRGRGRPKKAV